MILLQTKTAYPTPKSGYRHNRYFKYNTHLINQNSNNKYAGKIEAYRVKHTILVYRKKN